MVLARGSDYSGALTTKVTIQFKVVLRLAWRYVIALKLYEWPNETICSPYTLFARG